MELNGEFRIEATREEVWALLNDPETLKACVPGCEELEQTDENAFSAKVVLKIGPVKAKFSGNIELEDMVYPESYRIVGEGNGGVAGFAKGAANVTLTEDGGETVLNYEVDANIGGKIAQLGSRLIKSTSAKLAGQFFEKFSATAAGNVPEAAQ
ncbi:MAG: carbon monoxide dehydrogenase subunit G [Pseudomonadota bacterium]